MKDMRMGKSMGSSMGQSGEKAPKGVMASDRTGMSKGSNGGVMSEKMMPGASGEKMPKGVLSSDMSGQEKGKRVGGVAMGKEDGIEGRDKSHMGKMDGRLGEFKGGSSEKECYSHDRNEYK